MKYSEDAIKIWEDNKELVGDEIGKKVVTIIGLLNIEPSANSIERVTNIYMREWEGMMTELEENNSGPMLLIAYLEMTAYRAILRASKEEWM